MIPAATPRLAALRHHALLAFVSLVFLVGGTGCPILMQLVQKPQVRLNRVDLTGVSLSGIGANFVLDVDNPNPLGIGLASLAYRVTIEGNRFVEGSVQNAINLPAQGRGQVTIPVQINFVEFIATVQAMIAKSELPYELSTRLGFNTPMGAIEVPLAYANSFPVPKLPQMSFGRFQTPKVDAGGATFQMDLVVGNPNGFALPVGPINYKVGIGAGSLVTGSIDAGQMEANQQRLVPVTFRVPFAGAIQSVIGLIGGGASTKVSFDADLGVLGSKYPYHLEQMVNLR